jgi:hypothetical protein
MRAPVVKRRHFDVLDVAAAVRPLEFDAHVGEVHLAIEEREIVIVRPLLDLSSVAVRPPVCLRMVAFTFVQKALVFALQFVIEHDAMDTDVLFLKPLCRTEIGSMQLCVV